MIAINIDKAKSIAHGIRRVERSKEFEPLDSLISKQIPTTDITAVEASRELIRAKYALIQINIESALTTDNIKRALGV